MVAIVDADSLIYSSSYNVETLDEAINKFNTALESVLSDLSNYCEVTDVVICSGGDNKLRKAINKSYKANRSKDKPIFLSDLHDEVKLSYDSVFVDGYETDDVVASLWYDHSCKYGEDSVIIVANDKDYKQFPCWYFDTYWNRRNLDKIEEFDAIKNFYSQMIIGDTADNINYIKGKGKSFVNKYLKTCKTKYSLFRKVYVLFISEYGGDAKEKFNECYSLLKLRTDVFTVK